MKTGSAWEHHRYAECLVVGVGDAVIVYWGKDTWLHDQNEGETNENDRRNDKTVGNG